MPGIDFVPLGDSDAWLCEHQGSPAAREQGPVILHGSDQLPGSAYVVCPACNAGWIVIGRDNRAAVRLVLPGEPTRDYTRREDWEIRRDYLARKERRDIRQRGMR